MKNNFLLVNPHKATINNYYENKNIYFISYNVFSFYDNEKLKRCSINVENYKVNFNSEIDFKTILESLNKWNPIYTRWLTSQGYHHHFTREAALFIYKLINVLEEFNITKTIFNTGISHHIDTLLIQISCELKNLKMFFLYCAQLEARLILLCQNKSIFDRYPINVKVSNYDISQSLVNFISDTENKKSLPYGIEKDYFGKSLFISLLMLYILVNKNALRRFFKLFMINNSAVPFYERFLKMRYFNEAIIMIQQRNALIYYKDNVLDNIKFKQLLIESDSPKILIAAHFQPEATSDPEGGDYGNHIDICIKLRNLNYKDVIYYKEHPASKIYYERKTGPTRVGINRSIEYFKQLHEIGVSFLNFNYDFNYSVNSKESYLPVTITGTIAIERSLLGYHTIVMGEPWFKEMPGVIHISKINSLAKINKSWTKRNKLIAKEAFKFCQNHLGESTISNAFGIGTGRVLGKNETEKSVEEYSNILNKLDYYD